MTPLSDKIVLVKNWKPRSFITCDGEWIKEEDVSSSINAFLKDLKDDIKSGCGNDYIELTKDEDELELMCGKHIWKTRDVVAEYHLCEDCEEKLEWVDNKVKEHFGSLVPSEDKR